MNAIKPPFVSVIIVNYNGAHYLRACLDALQAQTYPKSLFETIVSDNHSTDGSLELLAREYPWVKVLKNHSNLGFAEGNNVGIGAAEGELIVLLNNDTAPTPDWLEKLVQVAQANPQAGLVTGHLQLFYDQLILEILAESFIPPNDGRELGVQVFGVESGAPRGVVQYLEGFYGRERDGIGRTFRWSASRARLGVPLPPGSGDCPVGFQLAASRPDGHSVTVRVSVHEELLAEWRVSGIEPSPFSLRLPAQVRRLALPLVQNAGSILFRDGSSRDRGTYVRHSEVFFETDEGQYNRIEEMFSGCGTNLLIRRQTLEDVGAFDNRFFMYYEDTDLSWRARLRGWKVIYAPQAVVRHIHCGSSEEWSPFFIFHTERNKLAMIFKNGSWQQILMAWGGYLHWTLRNGWRTLRAIVLRSGNWREHARPLRMQLRVLFDLLKWLPGLILARIRIQSGRTIPQEQIEAWFVG